MQVPALCANCGAVAMPSRTCRMCGSLVCTACFDVQSGTCELCSMKFGRRNIKHIGPKAKKH